MMLGSSLIVTHRSAAAADPGKRALHDPPARQNLEPDLAGEFRDDLDHQPQPGTVRDQSATVTAVDPDHPDLPITRGESPEQKPTTIPVLHRRAGDQHHQQQSARIDSDMPL